LLNNRIFGGIDFNIPVSRIVPMLDAWNASGISIAHHVIAETGAWPIENGDLDVVAPRCRGDLAAVMAMLAVVHEFVFMDNAADAAHRRSGDAGIICGLCLSSIALIAAILTTAILADGRGHPSAAVTAYWRGARSSGDPRAHIVAIWADVLLNVTLFNPRLEIAV
jgi:hypothetical protein